MLRLKTFGLLLRSNLLIMLKQANKIVGVKLWILRLLLLRKIILGFWFTKSKLCVDGFVEQSKACLVAKGYAQIEGLDYFNTFSTVPKMTTIHLLLALASVGTFTNQILITPFYMVIHKRRFTCRFFLLLNPHSQLSV